MAIYDRIFQAPLEPLSWLRTINCPDRVAAQAALDAALPGDHIVLAADTFTGGTSSTATLLATRSGTRAHPIGISGVPDLTFFDGQGTAEKGINVRSASWYVIRDIIFTGYEEAVQFSATHDAVGSCTGNLCVRCVATHCSVGGYHEAFRCFGPVTSSVFRYCLAYSCGMGFGLREDSPLGHEFLKTDACSPPRSGNFDYTEFLDERTWPNFLGWRKYAPGDCRFERCISFVAGAQIDNQQNTDNFYGRYCSGCTWDECIAAYGGDDNFDCLAGVDIAYLHCLAINGAYRPTGALSGPNGNGNGIKMGVRGGLRNRAIQCVSLWNKQAGVEAADCVYPTMYRNTCVWNGLNGGNGYGLGSFPIGSSLPSAAFPLLGTTFASNICWGNARGTSNRPQIAIGNENRIVRSGCNKNYMSDDGSRGFAIPRTGNPSFPDNHWGVGCPFVADLLTRPLPALPDEAAEMIPSNMTKLWNDTWAAYTAYVERADPATVPAAVGAPL